MKRYFSYIMVLTLFLGYMSSAYAQETMKSDEQAWIFALQWQKFGGLEGW